MSLLEHLHVIVDNVDTVKINEYLVTKNLLMNFAITNKH